MKYYWKSLSLITLYQIKWQNQSNLINKREVFVELVYKKYVYTRRPTDFLYWSKDREILQNN